MAYTKHIWANGELLDATKMNQIEGGIYDNAVTQATVSNGVVTCKNASGSTVYTITLPVYSGGIE